MNSEVMGITFLNYHTILMQYISRFISQKQDIEDIVNEAFLKTYEAGMSIELHCPKAYLFTTAKNLALKHLDKCSYRLVDNAGDLSTREMLVDELSAERRVQSQEQFKTFCRAASTLPLKCRKVFILRKIYGYSPAETASMLGLSLSTVEKHLATGIFKCSKYMRTNTDYFDNSV